MNSMLDKISALVRIALQGGLNILEIYLLKKDNNKFDTKFFKQVEEEVAIIQLICTDGSGETEPVNDTEVKKSVSDLNRGKA